MNAWAEFTEDPDEPLDVADCPPHLLILRFPLGGVDPKAMHCTRCGRLWDLIEAS